MIDAIITLLFYITIFTLLLCAAGFIADHTKLLDNIFKGE